MRPASFAKVFVSALALLSLVGQLALAQSDADANTAGNGCQTVLLSGINQMVSLVSPSSSTFSTIHQAACLDYSSYTYSDYQTDVASNGGIASTLAVASTAFGWGGATGGGDAVFTFQRESQFADAVFKAQAYRATACGSSTVNSSRNEYVSTLSQFLDPAVYTSYFSCLQLYGSGIRVSQAPGFNLKSVSFAIKFVPPAPGVKAYVNGLSMYPLKAATCTVNKPNTTTTPASTDPFKFDLDPYVSVSVFCQLASPAPNNTLYTDISVSTSAYIFHTLLFNQVPPSSTEMINRLVADEAKIVTLDSRVKALEAKLKALSVRH